jgi:polyisoprenoid-binding protein YceI
VDVGLPKFEDALRGEDWFDTSSHPQIFFRGSTIEVIGENVGKVTGDLTFLGRTEPVIMDVTFNGGAVNFLTGNFTLGFKATAVVDRTVFGMSNLAPRVVGSDVTLEIHVEFVRNK